MAVLFSDFIRTHDCKTADEGTKKLLGCDETLPDYLQTELHGFKLVRCPAWYVEQNPWVHQYLEIWNWREKGFLPTRGSWQDMPNKLCEILTLIDSLTVEKLKSGTGKRTHNQTASGR